MTVEKESTGCMLLSLGHRWLWRRWDSNPQPRSDRANALVPNSVFMIDDWCAPVAVMISNNNLTSQDFDLHPKIYKILEIIMAM